MKDQEISVKPGGGTFSGSSREGLGIGDSCDEAELESPCPCSFVLPSDKIGPFSYWNCDSVGTALSCPNLRGLTPLGLPGVMGVFLSSWGVHMLETPLPSCLSLVE